MKNMATKYLFLVSSAISTDITDKRKKISVFCSYGFIIGFISDLANGLESA